MFLSQALRTVKLMEAESRIRVARLERRQCNTRCAGKVCCCLNSLRGWLWKPFISECVCLGVPSKATFLGRVSDLETRRKEKRQTVKTPCPREQRKGEAISNLRYCCLSCGMKSNVSSEDGNRTAGAC